MIRQAEACKVEVDEMYRPSIAYVCRVRSISNGMLGPTSNSLGSLTEEETSKWLV